MKKFRIIIFGNHQFAVDLVSYILKNKKDKIVGVVCHPKYSETKNEKWYPSLREFALKKDLKVFSPRKLKTKAFFRKISTLRPDLMICVSYRKMIPRKIIDLAKVGAFNLHGSLLPKNQGWAPINWVLIKGERKSGSTAHFLVEKVDAGDIISQKSFYITQKDDAMSVYHKMLKTHLRAAKEAIEKFRANRINPLKQDFNQATYNQRRYPKDGRIVWENSANNIYNLVRGVTRPFQGAFCYYKNRKIIVWQLRIEKRSINGKPGEIAGFNNGKPIIATKDSAVKIVEILPQNILSDFRIGNKLR